MSSLSQAPRLGGLLPPHGAFQDHAAHKAEWSALLRPKGSLGTCIPKGVGPHSYTPLSRRTKAKPYGWRAKSTRASLDSARPAAGSWSPPGRKTGWGKGRATRVAVRSSVALPLVAAIRLRRHRSGSPWTSSLTWWLGVGGLLPWWRQARSGLHLRAEA